MDTRLEGIVEGLNTVGSQEQNALEVLQQTEEDADKGIAVDIVDSALFKENISLIEEEHRAPRVRDIQDLV